jgi:hypothetical protein
MICGSNTKGCGNVQDVHPSAAPKAVSDLLLATHPAEALRVTEITHTPDVVCSFCGCKSNKQVICGAGGRDVYVSWVHNDWVCSRKVEWWASDNRFTGAVFGEDSVWTK